MYFAYLEEYLITEFSYGIEVLNTKTKKAVIISDPEAKAELKTLVGKHVGGLKGFDSAFRAWGLTLKRPPWHLPGLKLKLKHFIET